MAPIPTMPDVAAAIYSYTAEALTCGRVPVFGSVEWVELADDDPAKQAAVVRAALAHWSASLVAGEAQVQASHAISAAYDWRGLACRPTREQVLRWRAR
jgi:hypothetical protein